MLLLTRSARSLRSNNRCANQFLFLTISGYCFNWPKCRLLFNLVRNVNETLILFFCIFRDQTCYTSRITGFKINFFSLVRRLFWQVLTQFSFHSAFEAYAPWICCDGIVQLIKVNKTRVVFWNESSVIQSNAQDLVVIRSTKYLGKYFVWHSAFWRWM